ncbi:glucose 1-dehydrogenase [Streptomyces sp. NPDC060085]|uniref:glucose 1-dehydrogenase n=1 Tax=Streptomyces sp. NPDC060085 TaxID=3347054 RepID=UPI00364CB3F2
MTQQLLREKVVLVTGGASGIGAKTAITFAENGAKVAVVDIDDEAGNTVISKIKMAGGRASFIQADISSERDTEEAVRMTVETFGRLDCAFNNAGIDGMFAPLHEATVDNWNQVLAVNLTGVWLCMRSQIRQMLLQGSGSIVNTASMLGLVGSPVGLSAYTAAKHGVIGLTKAAALEYGKRGIRVNAICPGAVRTPMMDSSIRQKIVTEEELAAPIGRVAETEEIAQSALWLCSDASSFVSGHSLAIDGGGTAQ